MSSVEIEDVLSSIRRLVSEDLRPLARPLPTALQTADLGSKLILTPALRVVDDATPPAQTPRTAPPTTKAALPDESVDPAVWAEAPFEFTSQRHPDASAGARLAAVLGGAAQPDEFILADPAEDSADAAPSLEDVVAALGAAVDAQEWEPDAEAPEPAQDWSHQDWPQQEWPDTQTEAVTLIDLDTVEDAEVLHSETGEEARLAASWADDSVIPEPEPLAENDFAPDLPPEPQPHVPHDSALDDIAEAAAVAEIEAAAMAAAMAAAADRDSLFAETETEIDESALRDMVRDMIREELQGTLGERITRNVRKLVRAEINRVLASRDLA